MENLKLIEINKILEELHEIHKKMKTINTDEVKKESYQRMQQMTMEVAELKNKYGYYDEAFNSILFLLAQDIEQKMNVVRGLALD